MFGGYSASKLKPQLKMAIHRFQISSNKKQAIMKQQKREISKMLAEPVPKEEKARIKAESLIRDDNTIEAYEIMQLECELLTERIKLISNTKECPPDLVSCVSTLMWASTRVDNIPELAEIRKQFKAKYGKKFDEAAMQNHGGVLNERVLARLSIQPPSGYLVQTYLEKIAEEFEVDWKPKIPLSKDDMMTPMPGPDGSSVPVGGGSGYGGMPTVVTGTDVTNSYGYGKDDGSFNNRGGGTPSVASSAAFPASGGAATAAARSSGGASAPPPPIAYAEVCDNISGVSPVPPPAGTGGSDDDEEGDIYVPAAPVGKKMGGGGSSVSSSSARGDDEPRDDDESGKGSAFDSLSQRFAKLKK